MILINFYSFGGELLGFELNGHSGYSVEGSDIVCAAVSSCAYMTVNTITDIIGVKADADVSDAHLSLTVSAKDAEKVRDIMRGFELHMKALADEYSEYIVCKQEQIQ